MPTAGPTAFANGKNLAAACGNLALTEGKNSAHTEGVNFTIINSPAVYAQSHSVPVTLSRSIPVVSFTFFASNHNATKKPGTNSKKHTGA